VESGLIGSGLGFNCKFSLFGVCDSDESGSEPGGVVRAVAEGWGVHPDDFSGFVVAEGWAEFAEILV
jgi:hypothetical protein